MKQLRKMYGPKYPYLRERLASIQHAVAVENQQHADVGDVTYRELFAKASDRRRTLIIIGVWIVFNFGGSSFTANGLYFLV